MPSLEGKDTGRRFIPVQPTTLNSLPADTVEKISGASVLLAKRMLANRAPYPSALKDLTCEDTSSSLLSASAALKLELPIGDGSINDSRKVFVYEYLKYEDIPDLKTDGKVRWGIAIRWISDIRIIDAKANISKLSIASASAELGYVNASSRLQVLGIASADITALMPTEIKLGVEEYARMQQVLADMKAEIWKPGTTVTPTVLALYGQSPENDVSFHEAAVAVTWALAQIAKGKPLGWALRKDREKTSASRASIESTYSRIVGSASLQHIPSRSERQNASTLLHGLSVK